MTEPETTQPDASVSDLSPTAAPVAADCCSRADRDPRIARYFDRRNERRRTGAERYEMGNVTRAILDALIEAGPQGHSVLEGGSGPGALLISLLDAGATSGVGIDLSPEAVAYATERAAAAGVADRATFMVGDAATVAVEPRDWVVLDKVICCYPDMSSLLTRTIAEATSLFAFAVPVSHGWRGFVAKTALAFEGLALRLVRRPCPAYVHDIDRIESTLEEAGFRNQASRDMGMWHVGVFARA